MSEETREPRHVLDVKSPIYHACGATLYRILPETDSDQVAVGETTLTEYLKDIQEDLSAASTIKFVNTIADRNVLTNLSAGDRVYVRNSMADTGEERPALYIWLPEKRWEEVAGWAAERMDIIERTQTGIRETTETLIQSGKDYEADIQTLRNKDNDLTERIADLNRHANGVTEKLNQLTSFDQSLVERDNNLDLRITDLEKQAGETNFQNEVNRLDAKDAEQDLRMDSLQRMITEVSDAKDVVKEIETSNREVVTRVEGLETRVESLVSADAEINDKIKALEARDKDLDKKDAAHDAAIEALQNQIAGIETGAGESGERIEEIENNYNSLTRQVTSLETAVGDAQTKAQDAITAAELAQQAANSALTKANEAKDIAQTANAEALAAKTAADNALALAQNAIPKTGNRGSLAGFEVAEVKSGSQSININSPDSINLSYSGTSLLTFVPAEATQRAVKCIALKAATDTVLTIAGATWSNNGDAPIWGNMGEELILLAHFVAGRVVLSVADNTQA